ncbi:hypothetical protein Ancab_005993, partial [Ancistrocladus abbreviatus]
MDIVGKGPGLARGKKWSMRGEEAQKGEGAQPSPFSKRSHTLLLVAKPFPLRSLIFNLVAMDSSGTRFVGMSHTSGQ